MNTRKKGIFEKGFYKALNQPKNVKVEKKIEKKNYKKFTPTDTELTDFVREVNLSILKKLKSSNSSRLTVCKIPISNRIFNFLKNKFDFTGNFKSNNDFTSFFNIKNERFFTNNNYCTYPSLESKISKGSKFVYYEKNMKKNYIFGSSILSIKFYRLDKVDSGTSL